MGPAGPPARHPFAGLAGGRAGIAGGILAVSDVSQVIPGAGWKGLDPRLPCGIVLLLANSEVQMGTGFEAVPISLMSLTLARLSSPDSIIRRWDPRWKLAGLALAV